MQWPLFVNLFVVCQLWFFYSTMPSLSLVCRSRSRLKYGRGQWLSHCEWFRAKSSNSKWQHEQYDRAYAIIFATNTLLWNRNQNRVGRHGTHILQRYGSCAVFLMLCHLFVWRLKYLRSCCCKNTSGRHLVSI